MGWYRAKLWALPFFPQYIILRSATYFMADDAIIQGIVRGLGSLSYVTYRIHKQIGMPMYINKLYHILKMLYFICCIYKFEIICTFGFGPRKSKGETVFHTIPPSHTVGSYYICWCFVSEHGKQILFGCLAIWSCLCRIILL